MKEFFVSGPVEFEVLMCCGGIYVKFLAPIFPGGRRRKISEKNCLNVAAYFVSLLKLTVP